MRLASVPGLLVVCLPLTAGCGLFFGDRDTSGAGGGGTTAATTSSATGGGGVGGAGGAGGGGALEGTYRTLSFTTAPAEALADVPVLVRLNPQRIEYAAMREDGRDLAFTDDEGTLLPHEFERWNPAGESLVWVRVPSIGGAKPSPIHMYYGDPERIVEPSPADVWATHYDLVYHFGEDADVTQFPDSATADGVNAGVPDGGGSFDPSPVARGWRLEGAPSVIEIGASDEFFSGWTGMTVEMWIRPDYANGDVLANEARFLDKGGPVSGGRLLTNTGNLGLIDAQIDLHFQSGPSCYSRISGLPRREFSQIAWTANPTTSRIQPFVDGAPVGSGCTMPAPFQVAQDAVWLGGYNLGLVGTLDEVRISRMGHSADWFEIQYLSMTDGLVQFGGPKTTK